MNYDITIRPIYIIIIHAMVDSSTMMSFTLGLSVIYNLLKFFHFAHGTMFMLGAYFVYLFFIIMHFSLVIALFLSILLVAILGVLNNHYVYKPIRKIGGTPLILLIASLGVYAILQNLVSLFLGDDTKSVRSGAVKEGLDILGAHITPVQIVIIISGIVLAILTWALLKYTKIGKASRAVANNPTLSEIYGINKEKIYNFVFAYGSALAAIAGILSALDTDMTPTMGFRPLMMGVIAMIIGGVGSIPGIVLGALLLGFAQNLAAWYLPSQWQDAIAFAIMLLFLLFRPQGFFGKPLRKAEV